MYHAYIYSWTNCTLFMLHQPKHTVPYYIFTGLYIGHLYSHCMILWTLCCMAIRTKFPVTSCLILYSKTGLYILPLGQTTLWNIIPTWPLIDKWKPQVSSSQKLSSNPEDFTIRYFSKVVLKTVHVLHGHIHNLQSGNCKSNHLLHLWPVSE